MDGMIVDNVDYHYRAWEKFCHGIGYKYEQGDSRCWSGNTNREIFGKIPGRKPAPEVPMPTAKEVEAGEVFPGEYKKKFNVIRPKTYEIIG